MLRHILLIFSTIFAVISAYGASFTVNAPRQVIKGNKFNITYSLENASGSGFKSPDVQGWKYLYGASMSQSMSSYSVNGKVTSSSSQSYTMTYKAEKEGTYTVGSATIVVDGKTYKTKPFKLQILPPDKSASNGSNQSQSVQVYDIDSQSTEKSVNKNDVFVRIILSKNSAYEQEGILCTIRLYTKYNIVSFMPTLQPSFNGFISQEIPITSQINRLENYKGENYMVADLKQCILFPQQTGKLSITSGNYNVTVVQYEMVRSIFGQMRRPVEKQIEIKSNNGTINISALPEPRPADFIGAVGSFKATAKMLNNNLKTNDSGTLRLTISGTGNLKNIKNPSVEFPSQFDVYDPQVTVDANPNGSSLLGSVTIDYAFVPQYVGKFTVKPITFSYYDINKKKYERVTLSGYDLNVAKGKFSGNSSVADLNQNKDILYIKRGDLKLHDINNVILYKWWYVFAYIVPFMLFALVLFYYRKLIKERANVTLMKTKKANKVATKRLKNARVLMGKNKTDEFYEELLRALWGYLSDKLAIPVSELNRDNIKNELDKYGVVESVIETAIDILDRCEFARYSSVKGENDMSNIYKEACELIDKIENTKRK